MRRFARTFSQSISNLPIIKLAPPKWMRLELSTWAAEFHWHGQPHGKPRVPRHQNQEGGVANPVTGSNIHNCRPKKKRRLRGIVLPSTSYFRAKTMKT